ncbi:hypothetical protein [Porphyromonas asaccharolytica]|jgi:hypothetical protein|uniref:hypothetical protein n=1 Tax=Porphyromonas asaccharolytica TaxID=28123 RepID=UPI00248E3839|nr:hypothetical protein [Porphyromonas asaccharolytica]
MTIDEITTALQEWRGDDEGRHYTLIAIDDDKEITVAVLGSDFFLGCALASAMRNKKQTERIIQWAMTLKEMDIFNKLDNDKE